MKLTKTKKIILLLATLGILTTSIVTPIVILNKDEKNKDEKNKENDVEKLFKILKSKTTKEKIIELPNDASGKIIANNQEKIIEKIKNLIDKENLKGVKIEVSMQDDTKISTIAQKIIIKLTKNKISKEIKDFSVKRNFTADEDIAAIRNILNNKTDDDLIITLPSNSSGKILDKINRDNIKKKLRILIDPSNINGDPNHSSLRGTEFFLGGGRAVTNISTTPKYINVFIAKSSGISLEINNKFQVKKA